MDAKHILNALHSKGLSYRRLANMLDVSKALISNVSARRASSHRIAVALATAIDKPIEQVFPDVPAYHRPYVPPAQAAEASAALEKQYKSMGLVQ